MSQPRPLAVRVLGELIVIVVGVLIALWVDNANSERQARGLETAHLSGILFDARPFAERQPPPRCLS